MLCIKSRSPSACSEWNYQRSVQLTAFYTTVKSDIEQLGLPSVTVFGGGSKVDINRADLAVFRDMKPAHPVRVVDHSEEGFFSHGFDKINH